MIDYTQEQIRAELQKQGASPYQAWVGSAIAMAESGGRGSATNDRPGKELSLGPFQINLLAHPDVTAECARSLACAAGKTKTISNNFADWSPWGAYTNGSYRSQLGTVPSEVKDEVAAKTFDLAKRVRLGGLPGGLTDQQAAAELQAAFPDLSGATLRQIIQDPRAVNASGPDPSQIPVLGGIASAIVEGRGVQGSLPLAKNLDELIQAMTKPENLWRVGFVALGAVMIFLGSRLYLTPEAQPIPLKGAV